MGDHQYMYDDEELVSADPDQRNWRGICIALLVIAIVCSLIVTAIFLLTPGLDSPRVKNPRFTLEEIISGELELKYFNGTWISGEELLFRDFYDNLVVYNAEKRSKTILMRNLTFKRLNAFIYSISSDKKYIILAPQFTKVYKYSYTANYIIYDLINQTEHRHPPNNGNSSAFLSEKMQLVSWGPTGNQFVYVQNNNIFYLRDINQNEPWQITDDGVDGLVYNGIPDWLYEHELFRNNKALWWSNDGTKICYATFNDTLVKPLEYTVYGSFENLNNIYPNLVGIRYPKAGQSIPNVTISVRYLGRSKTNPVVLAPPEEFSNVDYYVTAVKWIDNESVSINWLARWQNTSIISIYSGKKGWKCEKILQVDSSTEGWVEMNEAPIFTRDKRHFFLRLPVSDGEAGDFWHIAKINTENGRKDFLTHGKYDVTKIAAYEEQNNTIYFITTLLNRPGERHLVRINDNATDKRNECLTCNLDEKCLYNDVKFGVDARYYVLECLGPGVPRMEIRKAHDHFLVKVLDRNDYLRDVMNKRASPQIRTFQVPLSDNTKANVRMFLPPGLRDDEIVKYPLIINVDGSPGSQTVSEKFQLHWGIYLASKKKFLYVWIDGRGSGFQGNKRLHQVYGQLGIVEVEDYITVTRYLKDHLPFVNGDNILIWGWGYGGYASALALIREETVFECAISVAPVTNWVYHNAYYSERYMKIPKSPGNLIGYEKTDVSTKAHLFKGKKFLVIHGTADEIVHLQHSMMLIKSLTKEGVLFRSQLYPDENHDLKNVKKHLYLTMEDFLQQCFQTENAAADVKSNR